MARQAGRSGSERDKRKTQGERGESEKERVDRELIELLNELRVVLPGVQVLFAFLLTVPFSNGFPKMTGLQRDVFFVSFLGTTVATILLIAPTTYHRIRFRRGDKERMLRTSNVLALAGTVFLAVAMACALFVITDILFGVGIAALVAAMAALAFVGLWYGLPLYRQLQER
jgi:Family of unknown function (DUF6328)